MQQPKKDPPPPPRRRRREPRPRRHSRLGIFFMLVGFVTVCLLLFRYLIVPLLVYLK